MPPAADRGAHPVPRGRSVGGPAATRVAAWVRHHDVLAQHAPTVPHVRFRRRSWPAPSRGCRARPTGSRCARSSRPRPRRCASPKGQAPEGAPDEVTIATVLPLAWPGLHRESGEVLVGIQSGNASGDTSRDIAAAIALAAAAEPGAPVDDAARRRRPTPRACRTSSTPTRPSRSSCTRASTSGSPTPTSTPTARSRSSAPTSRPSRRSSSPPRRPAYWCRIGERTYVRWVLPLRRGRRDQRAGPPARRRREPPRRDGRLLGCFRSSGLLIPVWEVDPDAEAARLRGGRRRDGDADRRRRCADTEPLDAAERGAKAGLTNRQVTLR